MSIQNILAENFTVTTGKRQAKRGTIQFTSNFKRTKPRYDDRKNCDTVDYMIYANGKVRMASPGWAVKSMHIVSDLKRPIETEADFDWALEKVLKSIKRYKATYGI